MVKISELMFDATGARQVASDKAGTGDEKEDGFVIHHFLFTSNKGYANVTEISHAKNYSIALDDCQTEFEARRRMQDARNLLIVTALAVFL